MHAIAHCLNPYLWLGRTFREVQVLKQLRESPSIYLVESIDYLEDFDLLVNDTWEWILKEQLNGWMRDLDSWPDELSREMSSNGLTANYPR